jgi:hypothetical protein
VHLAMMLLICGLMSTLFSAVTVPAGFELHVEIALLGAHRC